MEVIKSFHKHEAAGGQSIGVICGAYLPPGQRFEADSAWVPSTPLAVVSVRPCHCAGFTLTYKPAEMARECLCAQTHMCRTIVLRWIQSWCWFGPSIRLSVIGGDRIRGPPTYFYCTKISPDPTNHHPLHCPAAWQKLEIYQYLLRRFIFIFTHPFGILHHPSRAHYQQSTTAYSMKYSQCSL